MKKFLESALIAAMAGGATLTAGLAYADNDRGHRYAVTVTNITRGQILAPPAVIVHDDGYSLFSLGVPARPELAELAERGNPGPLLADAATSRSVYYTAAGGGGIPPGASQTIEVEANGRYAQISVAAMLVSTNDAFAAVRGISTPRRGTLAVEAEAYDAGSEANSESCAFIPGPPCGSDVHDPAPAEGYVHVHPGIHGGAGLTPAMHDWRNPVAQIEIRRVD